MITREQVADLQPGDVVELRDERYPGVLTTGPLRDDAGELLLGGFTVRAFDGLPAHPGRRHLTVISRAPRPLYVNHPRTEPVPGDVVRDADRPDSVVSWSRAVGSLGNHGWRYTGSANHWHSSMPARLRLLVDGETGQVVQ